MGPEAALHRQLVLAHCTLHRQLLVPLSCRGNHSDRGTIPWTVRQEQPGKEENSKFNDKTQSPHRNSSIQLKHEK